MQITPKNQANAIDAYNSTQVQVRQKPGIEEGTAYDQQIRKTDTVVISDAAKRIQEAQSKIQAIPDVRTEKVAELKARIENGTYEINPDKIADKMIRESLINELLK